jgi:hypothetical protein
LRSTCREFYYLDASENLAFGIGMNLAVFSGYNVSKLVDTILNNPQKSIKNASPSQRCAGRPGRCRLACRSRGLIDLRRCRDRHQATLFARCRIEYE